MSLRHKRLVAGWFFAFVIFGGEARAADLTVMISGGLNSAYRALAPEYEKSSGNTLVTVEGASMGANPTAIPARLDRGEPADVVIVLREAMDKLVAKGQVEKESVVDLGIGHIAMAVKAGAPKPDIRTVDSFRNALLAAKSAAYTDSAGGIYLQNVLFKRLGIEKQMTAKSKMISGLPVGPGLARGEYEIAFQQLSELKSVQGIEIVGLIPDVVQKATTFSAGIATRAANPQDGREHIHLLASPAAFPAIESSGLEPAQLHAEASIK